DRDLVAAILAVGVVAAHRVDVARAVVGDRTGAGAWVAPVVGGREVVRVIARIGVGERRHRQHAGRGAFHGAGVGRGARVGQGHVGHRDRGQADANQLAAAIVGDINGDLVAALVGAGVAAAYRVDVAGAVVANR